MAAIIKKAYLGYQYLFEEITDPRTNNWFLVARPYQGLLLLGLYLMFITKWGPQFMKNRKPFNLEKILILYNAVQVVLCAYIFIGGIRYAWGWKYRWVCEPVDYSDTEQAITIARFVHYYFLSKILDLLDTVFFILRKKFNQVSFLHVYHHTGMVMLVWAATTYYPGGHGSLIGVINSFVHIVMYGYYLLTVAYPSYKQSLWWKKHITQLQIIQFFWCSVHMMFIVFKPDCEYPRWTAAVFLPQNIFMLILFIDFYMKTYVRKPEVRNKAQLEVKGTKYHRKDKENDKVQSNGKKHDSATNKSGNQNGVGNGLMNGYSNGTHKILNGGKNVNASKSVISSDVRKRN